MSLVDPGTPSICVYQRPVTVAGERAEVKVYAHEEGYMAITQNRWGMFPSLLHSSMEAAIADAATELECMIMRNSRFRQHVEG